LRSVTLFREIFAKEQETIFVQQLVLVGIKVRSPGQVIILSRRWRGKA